LTPGFYKAVNITNLLYLDQFSSSRYISSSSSICFGSWSTYPCASFL